MMPSDVNNKANDRMKLIDAAASPKPSKEQSNSLPKDKYQGKNKDGYDIIPNENK